MIFKKTKIDGCYKIIPKKNYDLRGSFHRSFCKNILKNKKINFDIKQCNLSINNKKYTLRGFHFENKPYKEDKIINVISGKIYNVTIDIRKKSKTYLQKNIITMSSKNGFLLLIPAGCANAFLTLEENTVINYFMSDYFTNKKNRYSGFTYDDPFFSINWPTKPKIISSKDKSFQKFKIK
jgi:dTDP-4-dehydrorhamnose 3,5-epimerase